jgi:acyl-CoA reductase-like NAD-dependent aldehyde dehydrogenase
VLDAFLFAEAVADAGIPPGVINIVPGGREIGAYLVQQRDVDKVAFTGSTAAGRRIAGNLRPPAPPGHPGAGRQVRRDRPRRRRP